MPDGAYDEGSTAIGLRAEGDGLEGELERDRDGKNIGDNVCWDNSLDHLMLMLIGYFSEPHRRASQGLMIAAGTDRSR
jgi:hypothetical protein